MKPPEKLYKFHVANLHAISGGLEHVLTRGRDAVARSKEKEVETFVRLYAFLLGAWSECRLLKLIFEPNAFTDIERRKILAETALNRWHKAIELAFRKHCNISSAELKPPAMPYGSHSQYLSLKTIIDNDLHYIIALRNKLAHGQWIYPLVDDLSDIAQTQMNALRHENLLSLLQKRTLIESVCAAVHDLAVSLPTFQRDWDMHYRHIEQTRLNIQKKSYATWATSLRLKYENGQERRKENTKAAGSLPAPSTAVSAIS